jgi:NAD(P)-dependent dehydrogenase (short-subunit alcohol dehydrogenase family)
MCGSGGEADLAAPDGPHRLAKQVRAIVGDRLDILVANAGISKAATIEETTVEDFDKLFAVNVRAPFFLVQQLLPILSKGSSIVFVSSLAARAVVGTIPAYAATKGGIDTMVKHFASLFGERYIRVNAVAPASSRLACRSSPRRTWAGTSLWACRRSSALPSPTTLAAWSPSSPLGTPGGLQALPSMQMVDRSSEAAHLAREQIEAQLDGSYR